MSDLKSKTKKVIVFSLLQAFVCHHAFGLSTIPSACPKRYVGKTLKVEDIVTPLSFASAQPWIKVEFEVDETLVGEVAEKIVLRIMKASDFKFEEGEDYEISMREKFLCSMKKI